MKTKFSFLICLLMIFGFCEVKICVAELNNAENQVLLMKKIVVDGTPVCGKKDFCAALLFLTDFYEEQKEYSASLEFCRRLVNIEPSEENKKKEIQLIQKSTYSDYNMQRLYGYSFDNDKNVSGFAFCAILKILIDKDQTEDAEDLFAEYILNQPDFFKKAEIDEIVLAFEKDSSFKGKKPMLAAGLSFVPGMGQFYAHEWKDGLNALILNGSLWAISLYSVWNLNFMDFFFLEMNPDYRFFRGNLYNAQKDVYKYNKKKKIEIWSGVNKILDKRLTLK